MASTCILFREVAFVRLRIAPFAELSGLGAATTHGGRMLSVLRGTMLLLEQARHNEQAVHSPLQRQVSELSRTVQRQEQLLHSLTNHPSGIRAGSASRRTGGALQLQNVRPSFAATTAREGTTESYGSGSSNSREGPLESHSSGRTPRIALGSRLSSSNSNSSDQALSFNSNGNSPPPRWGNDLPPAVIGRSSRTLPNGSPTGLSGRVSNAEVTALVTAVQLQQQQLLAALQCLAQPPGSGMLEAGED